MTINKRISKLEQKAPGKGKNFLAKLWHDLNLVYGNGEPPADDPPADLLEQLQQAADRVYNPQQAGENDDLKTD